MCKFFALLNPTKSTTKLLFDKRKLFSFSKPHFIALPSLPKITVLNGSEVTVTEREKAERFYLRHFMDAEDKPDNFHTLVEKHGKFCPHMVKGRKHQKVS